MQFPAFIKSYKAPDSSSSSSSSASYDYSGLDEHLKRQEMLAGQRDAKFGALYNGDVAGSVAAGSRVRDLLKAIRMHAPGADERDPIQMVNPLVRVSSTSSSTSNSSDGGSWGGDNEHGQVAPLPQPGMLADPPERKRPNAFADPKKDAIRGRPLGPL